MAAFKGSHTRIVVVLTVHWMEPGRIALKNGDRRTTKLDGSKPGIWITASSNPDHADYNPNNFNRWAGFLHDLGLPAPDPVPEYPRRLDRRWALMSPKLRAKIRKQASS